MDAPSHPGTIRQKPANLRRSPRVATRRKAAGDSSGAVDEL
jgi:hypothetical protein